jgi:Zn-dependent protease
MGWLSIGLAAGIGIAWGATPVTPGYFRHRRWGDVIVSFAGPAVNLCLAVVAALVLVLSAHSEAPSLVTGFWHVAAMYNVALFLLNMIPVPPLDGFTVASGFFEMGEAGRWLRSLHPWPLVIVLVLLSRGPFWEVARQGAAALVAMWAAVFGAVA